MIAPLNESFLGTWAAGVDSSFEMR